MEATTNTRLENAKQWVEDHRRQLLSVLAIVAVIIVLIGLSLTWFVNSQNLSTITKIQTPADPKMLGPNKTSIGTMEIAYDEKLGNTSYNNKDEQGNVTIRRAFCVQSNKKEEPGGEGQAFELQLANTTNITGLTINVYRVTVNNPSKTDGDVVGLDGLNERFSWSINGDAIKFNLINPTEPNDPSLAKELEENDPTFGTYKNVQKNARPLYRYKKFEQNDLDKNSQTGKANDATNFIIECKWNANVANNLKETDVLYLIAPSNKKTSD